MLDTGRANDALAITEAGLKYAPEEPGLLQNKALSLMLGRDPAGAAAVYAKVVAASPSDEELRFSYAQALAEAGQKDAARVQLKKLASSKSVAVLNSVADTLGRLGDYAACVSAIDAALVIDAKSELYVRRGVCRGSLDDSSGAQADFKKATEVDPESATAQYYLGKSLVKTDKKAARAALERAATLATDNPKLQAAAKKALAEL
jgi:Flp pilus assembly protein TadD